MQKRFLIFSVFVLFLISTITACQSSSNSDNTVDPLSDGVLNVACDPTGVPMEFMDENNNLVGFDIDFANALGKELGVEVDIQSVAWDGIFTGLTSNQYDVLISSTSITPERSQNYSQSDPYISNGIVIVGPADDTENPQSLEELDGKVVGTQIETSADTAIQKLNEDNNINIDLKKYDEMLSVFTALEGGQLDYVVTDIGYSQYFVNQHPEDFKIVTEEPITNEPIGVTASKDNVALFEEINDAIAKLKEDGTLAQISEKWYGTDMTSGIDTTLRVIE